MKTLITLLLLSCTLPAMATEIDAKRNADRYVADDIEIVTLPNGEVVTRLVSNSKLTVRQFWTNSHGPQGFIAVFPGQRRTTRTASGISNGGITSGPLPTVSRVVRRVDGVQTLAAEPSSLVISDTTARDDRARKN